MYGSRLKETLIDGVFVQAPKFSRLMMFSLTAAAFIAAGCSDSTTYAVAPENRPRLVSRPNPYIHPSLTAGLHRLTWNNTRIIAYVPPSAYARTSMPVVLLLHGSARDAEQLVEAQRAAADRDGVVILAPYAALDSWDAIYTTFGPDVEGIDRALAWLFDRLPVNPSKVAITGFSDGATYSLAIGRANGDLFSHVIAYSPGFVLDVVPVGNPQIAISHGTYDEELPYSNTRDRIVPKLREDGYEVDFRTFEGPHWIFQELAEEVFDELGGGSK